jgi:hypothetical protein
MIASGNIVLLDELHWNTIAVSLFFPKDLFRLTVYLSWTGGIRPCYTSVCHGIDCHALSARRDGM